MILPYFQQAYSSTRNLTCFQQSYKSSRFQQKLTLFASNIYNDQTETQFLFKKLIKSTRNSLSFQEAYQVNQKLTFFSTSLTVIISFFNKLHISQPKMHYTIKLATHLFSIYSQTLQFQSSHFQQVK